MATKRVLVVGGGLAGVMAALGARMVGTEVTLVARAPGATALYAGAMEMGADLGRLLSEQLEHPFSRLGFDEVRLNLEMEQAVAHLTMALEKSGLPMGGGWRRQGVFADLHGELRTAQLAPASVWRGELGALASRHVGVVGIQQVGDYDAEVVAEALSEQAGVRAEPVAIDLPDLPRGATVADLVGRPAPRPGRGRFDVLAYPPGFEHLPPDAFELLCAVPPVHGWRLQQGLQRAARSAGTTWVQGTVSGFDGTLPKLRGARLGQELISADQVVLATGRFIGGGVIHDRHPREALLGLPVFEGGEALEGAHASRFRHLEQLSPEPAFRMGVRVDAQLRPLDQRGDLPWRNLRAAGAVLGGYDYARNGFGVPTLTGWLAGRMAAAA